MERKSRSNTNLKTRLLHDIQDIFNKNNEVRKSIDDAIKDTYSFLENLFEQVPQSLSGPLISKTPKVPRKKRRQYIETIPEDTAVEDNLQSFESTMTDIKQDTEEEETSALKTRSTRTSHRKASKKAQEIIKKQWSMQSVKKLRRPDDDSDNESVQSINKNIRNSKVKRTKLLGSNGSDSEGRKEEEQSKLSGSLPKKNSGADAPKPENKMSTLVDVLAQDSVLRRSSRKRSAARDGEQDEPDSKRPNNADDTIIASGRDSNKINEHSMYEDAISKPSFPPMNSTMKHNSTMTLEKMMNVTVVLDPIPPLNTTVTLNKEVVNATYVTNGTDNANWQNPNDAKVICSPVHANKKVLLQKYMDNNKTNNKMLKIRNAIMNGELDALLTDDESSPDFKTPRAMPVVAKQNAYTKNGRQTRSRSSLISSDEEVSTTPAKPVLKQRGTKQEVKTANKHNVLFSPYAKESVKKRVEAFEQASMNSPISVNVESSTRMTRTKTRALAAAENTANNITTTEKTVAQKLARKSLAKAKKISLAKHMKAEGDLKENEPQVQQITKAPSEKQKQKIMTPLNKQKTLLPLSVNRIQYTPVNSQHLLNVGKATTGARSNIVTSVESFLSNSKPNSKLNSADKMEEHRRKPHDEDARRKKDEALRLQTEEKRKKREEKEMKNRLAREAKERQELEKRLKAEKEREERARIAQLMHEKQREELEKKKIAMQQRAQEKEEKRRYEEQQRLLRMQELEEAERKLAEQRRREQEAEKRKDAEARLQQQATTKTQLTHMKAKQTQATKNPGPENYVLDSDPDEDESDDESRPKHEIPHWALSHVRSPHLVRQSYIPQVAVLSFFNARKCTPDLTKIFRGIDRSRLKRTSSAIWKTPPRYSMMDTELKRSRIY